MQTMYETVKIGILGGDVRQITLARRLGEIGFECAAWGLDADADIGKAVRCWDWKGAVRGSKAVILPLPASRDGIYINSPFETSDRVLLARLIDELSADTVLIGGKFDLDTINAVKARRISVFDYNESEEFQIKNAVLTAEGAIETAMRETDIMLSCANVFLLGYGRISKVLFSMLKAFSCKISVAARKEQDLAFAAVLGAEAVPFGSLKFIETARSADVIFNTVPAEVLSKPVINELGQKCVIIDLASGSGGTDFSYAKERGIKALHALALPGKVAPVTAGNIICDSILTLLTEERGEAKL